jgi:hypothetical protein
MTIAHAAGKRKHDFRRSKPLSLIAIAGQSQALEMAEQMEVEHNGR